MTPCRHLPADAIDDVLHRYLPIDNLHALGGPDRCDDFARMFAGNELLRRASVFVGDRLCLDLLELSRLILESTR